MSSSASRFCHDQSKEVRSAEQAFSFRKISGMIARSQQERLSACAGMSSSTLRPLVGHIFSASVVRPGDEREHFPDGCSLALTFASEGAA
jgi:hypothetical protein